MNQEVNWELLACHLSGQCTPRQEQEFARWVTADKARGELVATMRTAWQQSGTLPPQVDTNAAWQKVAARTGIARPAEHTPARSIASKRTARTAWQAALRMAAVLAGVALAGVIWHLQSMRPEPMPSFADAARVHEARPGQRLELRLSDGTRVVLAPASVLRAANEFGERSRRVQLDGEAFFEVTHNETKPFVVHTAHGLASDLGTKFVVRAFPTDTAALVVVAEGVVSLKPAVSEDSVLLNRGDLGRIAASGELTAERDVDLDAYFAWTEGRLVFDDTPLNEAVKRLNQWYDLDIRVADSTLARMHVTAVFTDEPVSQMLHFLTLPLGLEYEQQGRTIVLRKNRR